MTMVEWGARHPRRARLLLLVCGALLPLAFAPYDIPLAAVFSMACLFLLWQQVPPREAAWRGYCFGLGMFGHGVGWIQVSIHQFGLPLYSFSVTMTALFVAFMALYPALGGYLALRLPTRSEHWRPLVLMAPTWILLEWLRGWLFTGFPWLHLGYSQVDGWLAGFAPLLGVHGVSAAVAGLAALLAVATRSPGRDRIIAITGSALVIVSSLLLSHVEWTHAEGPAGDAALVQGAVPQALKWREEFRNRTLELYADLSAPQWGKSLVLWPETAIPAFPEEIAGWLRDLGERAERAGTALLVGMPDGARNGGAYFNSVVLLNPPAQRYAKHHLVPFGEYLPFEPWLRPLLDFLTIPMSSFSAGAGHQPPLVHAGLRIGVSVCYEDAYAHEIRKSLPAANVLVNVSDDAWFGDSIAPHQHLQISRMRALEAGRYLLRATNTGISAIIDARGQVTARSPQFEPHVLTGRFERRSGSTPFVRFGHLPVLCSMTLLILAALAPVGRRS